MILVDDLVKRFGRTTAVDHVSFQVRQGEIVGFLGPNGAGKTTTIRVLTCYHPPTSGRAEVGGYDCFDAPIQVRQQIGYLPQDVPIYPDMRVTEYLWYRAALKGVPRRARRQAVERAIERAGVDDVRRKLVGQVSHGYRQRVGLADALVASPPVLILDEPTSGLDPNQRRRMKELVRELAADHTVLFSSHILGEVADVADRVVIIHEGALKAEGTVEELLRDAPGRRLVVTARCTADALRTLGADLPRVVGDGVCVEGSGADGFTTMAWPLAAEGGGAAGSAEDPRDEIYRRAVASGVALRDLRLELPTLESFFERVTEGGGASSAGAADRGEDDGDLLATAGVAGEDTGRGGQGA